MNFENLGLKAPILKALKEQGYTNPTPIQMQSIPLLLSGNDLLACAQTGTGKTAAFTIPIIQHLAFEQSRSKDIKALIVTPTRELAIQIEESIAAYGKHTSIKQSVVFGGVNQYHQVQSLKKGVDILVATPGRLLDLVNQGLVHLDRITHFVLDEADRMLDMGFIHDVKKIIRLIPENRQTLLFSATMPDSIMDLAHSILKNPKTVEVTPVSSTAEKIQQEVFFVGKNDKSDLLIHLIKERNLKTVLVFTRTKYGADKLVKTLKRSQISAEAIHGNKSQNARQAALQNFKNNRTRVLVATDIAARGIDIDSLETVFNYELPNIAETYVHRIGRTGRAGASGCAISLCDSEEKAYLKDIQKLIKIQIPVSKNPDFVITEKAPATDMPQRTRTDRPQSMNSRPTGNKNFSSKKQKPKRNAPKRELEHMEW
jgi:ATP-dependent RNA helicase RhlE